MTLTRRLVADALRRMWVVYAIAPGMVIGLMGLNDRAAADGVSLGSPNDLFAWSMTAALFLAFAPVTVLGIREIALLPVLRREMWLARWWLAVAIPSVPIALGAGGGMLADLSPVDGERLSLVVLYCVLYGGCFMALSAVYPLTAVAPFTGGGFWAVVRILLLVIGVPLGGAALPFWLAPYLPQSFSELTGPALGSLIAAAGITAATYFHYPAIAAGPGRTHVSSSAPAAKGVDQFNGIGGIALLFWKEGRRALAIYCSTLVLVVIFWTIFFHGTLAEFLSEGSALIFAGLPQRSAEYFPVAVMFLSGGSSDVGLAGEIRGLRALPISASRLAAVLTSLGILTTAVLWIALLIAHVVAVGAAPALLRPDLFFVVAGAFALSTTIRLALPAATMAKILASAFVFVPVLIAFKMGYVPASGIVRAAMIASGGAALVLSWLLNRRTLRRGRQVYKAKPAATPISF